MRGGSSASDTARQRRITSWTSGRFIEYTCLSFRRRTSGWSASVGGGVVAQLAVLDDRVAHVDPEARDAALVPEAQDRVEGVAHLVVPPVQVGLRGQELVEVVLTCRFVQRPGRAAEVGLPVVGRSAARRRVGPDVVVAVRRVTAAQRIDEPGVPVRRVVRDEVEQHAGFPVPRRGDQRVEVLERSQLGVDGAVVGDVVAPVVVRRGERRVEPEPVDPQPLEVIEARHDAPQVADPVAVRVRERTRIDLVENAVAPPRAVSHMAGQHTHASA